MHDFHRQLVAVMPKLRLWAVARTRDRAEAEDLVQETVLRALAHQGSFRPGSNFGAWIYRILHNRHLDGFRRRRPTCQPDEASEDCLAVKAPYEDRVALRELRRALRMLAPEQREALLMVALQGMSYEEAAETVGCAVGTIKSRVHRARHLLHSWMMGDDDAMVVPPETEEPAWRRPPPEPRPSPGAPSCL